MLAPAFTGKLEASCLISFIKAFTFPDLADRVFNKISMEYSWINKA